MVQEITLDVDKFSSRESSLSYPYFELGDLNDVTPLVVGVLDNGDIPLVGQYKGVTKILRRVSSSAFNVSKLLRIQLSVTYHKSETESYPLRNILDYLEVV